MAKKKLTNKAKRDKQRIKTHQDAKVIFDPTVQVVCR